MLPSGIVFVPPKGDTATTMTLATVGDTRRTVIGKLADNVSSTSSDSTATSPPWMTYAPTNQPMALSAMSADFNPKKWFYVELQDTGASNHLGRVLIVLAKGIVRNTGTGKAVIDVASDSQFAALSLRPNGDVSMTLDPDEMEKAQ
jgi:hypothetical protein